jgi:hypothetical protein
MTPQELWSRIKTSVGNDPRWWTTPAGMVAGVALTRALVPERRRTPGAYAVGAGIGGAAGLGGGTLLQAQGQAPERAALKQHAETLLSQDPKQVSATGGNPAAVADAARKAAVLHYEDKPLEYFSGPLDPREINAAKLALGEQNPYYRRTGGAAIFVGAAAGAAAPTAVNWIRYRKGLAAAKDADLQAELKKSNPVTANSLRGLKAQDWARKVGLLLPNLQNLTVRRLPHFIANKGFLPVVSGLTGGLGTGVGTIGHKFLGEGSRKKFDEALGWQLRAAHLESMQRFQQASLDEDQRQALQSALDNARHMADKRRSAAYWNSWFDMGWPGSDTPGR